MTLMTRQRARDAHASASRAPGKFLVAFQVHYTNVYFRAPNHHNDAINDINDINDKDNDGQTVATPPSLFFFTN